jgi:peptide/nickel transport system substrate-binding protein
MDNGVVMRLRLLCGVLLAALVAGCTQTPPKNEDSTAAAAGKGPAQTETEQPKQPATASTDSAAASDVPKESKETPSKPFQLGDLLKPFTPPPLAEIDAKAEWVDQPVLDSLVLLRERQKDETPLATVQEALKLRNTSPENNAKILSALGRLPANDGQVDWNAVMVRHQAADVKSTNPVMASSEIEFDVGSLTAFGLFSFDWALRPFAAKETVVSWQTSKDRMMDKVVIRDDLTWSDGKPITAHDVVFSFRLIMTDAVPVPAQRSGTDKIRWIEAYDDHTLVYFHQAPLATNVWNLNFSVVPKHIYENSVAEDPTLSDSKYHVQQENHPVCGGPYEFAGRTRGKEIVLRARESYYMHGGKQVRDRPYFKEVRFNIISDPTVALLALKKGELDEYVLMPEQWMTQTGNDEFYYKNTKAYGLEWVDFHFGWNLKTPYFADVRVRKAMSYAFNYQEMLGKLLYGLYEPSTGIFQKTSPWYPKEPLAPYHQDLGKAEALLDEAGWTDSDGDGVRDKTIDGRKQKFEFSILCNSDPLRIQICTLLKENLDRIGVQCNVRPLEFTVLMDKTQKREFDAFMGGWGAGTDPDTSDNIWGTGEARNFVGYSNPEVDALFKRGREEFDPEKRLEIYRKIHKIIYDEQPYTWLYSRSSFYGFSKTLRGYNFSPRGPYHYGPGFGSFWKPTTQ